MNSWQGACARLRRRAHRAETTGEEGFALIYSVLLMTVVLALSLSVLALMINQVRPTQFARKSTQTLNSAEAGFDAALNRLRSSTNATGAGLLSALPQCPSGSDHAVVAGAVTPAGGNTYTTEVYYLLSDPVAMDLATVKSNHMTCSPLQAVPRYAYLRSAGAAPGLPGQAANVGNRTLHAVYQFSTTNGQVTGGRIKEYPYPGHTADLCWDAGNAPDVGTPLALQACLAPGTASQSFVYRADLSILWSGDASKNLCAQAAAADGTPLRLATCAGVAPGNPPGSLGGTGATYPYPAGLQVQEWPFDDNGHFEGAADNGNVNGKCITPPTNSPVAGVALQVGPCSGGTDSYQAFNPDPSAGAGAASGTTTGLPGTNGQLVNYQEFGRCLDVTGQDVNAAYLIDYPCKQAPDPAQVRWNQRFAFTPDGAAGQPGPGTLSTNSPSGLYCLTAGATPSDPVRITPCVGGATGATNTTAAQKWTLTGKVLLSDGVTNDYENSYNIKNRSNSPVALCLSLKGAGNLDPSVQGSGTFDAVWSTMFLEGCNGADRQKWNAPAGTPSTRLTSVGEDRDH